MYMTDGKSVFEGRKYTATLYDEIIREEIAKLVSAMREAGYSYDAAYYVLNTTALEEISKARVKEFRRR